MAHSPAPGEGRAAGRGHSTLWGAGCPRLVAAPSAVPSTPADTRDPLAPMGRPAPEGNGAVFCLRADLPLRRAAPRAAVGAGACHPPARVMPCSPRAALPAVRPVGLCKGSRGSAVGRTGSERAAESRAGGPCSRSGAGAQRCTARRGASTHGCPARGATVSHPSAVPETLPGSALSPCPTPRLAGDTSKATASGFGPLSISIARIQTNGTNTLPARRRAEWVDPPRGTGSPGQGRG